MGAGKTPTRFFPADIRYPVQRDNMELSFVVINDLRKERYQIDRDPEGKDTSFRNSPSKRGRRGAAMGAGLAPEGAAGSSSP